ncbi:MAG: DUF1573 domain-containing protein [Bacteroidetes bacterium]|nr:DUF1573 domain-containing protein [Bacteroidota bacterium]
MKYLFLSLILLATSFKGFAQTNSETNAPVLKLETMTLDYGTVAKGSNKNRIVKFTNTGKSPLIIVSCEGSCECTTGKCPHDPIMPGKTGEIVVTYNTDKVGKFNKTVTISSNNGSGNIYLNVKGVVTE